MAGRSGGSSEEHHELLEEPDKRHVSSAGELRPDEMPNMTESRKCVWRHDPEEREVCRDL